MKKNLTHVIRLATASAVAFPFCLQAGIDQNNDGLSDIWVLKFGAAGLLPNADTDGDGFNNLQEATAATDPRNPNSKPDMAISSPAAGNLLNLTFATEAGKKYDILQQADLSGAWLPTDTWNGSGLYPFQRATQSQLHRVSFTALRSLTRTRLDKE